MPITIDATQSAIDRSRQARYGDRYYPVDESYDKRVYENSVLNWIRIIVTLIAFWIFQAAHWWFTFELGINWSSILMYYSFVIFGFTVIVGICMLISGKFANRKKRMHEYLSDRLAEKKALRLEEENRKKQEEEYLAQVAKAKAQKEKEQEGMNYAINEGTRA